MSWTITYLGSSDLVRPSDALEDLTGGVCTQFHTKDIMDKDLFWKHELTNVTTGYLLSVRTEPYERDDWTQSSVKARIGRPIVRTYEGYGERLVLLRYVNSILEISRC